MDKNLYKILFFKMPKVASDTIWGAINNSFHKGDHIKKIEWDSESNEPKYEGVKLDMLRHGEFSDNVFKTIKDSDFSFCFVRNPYLRFVSNWHWCAKKSPHRDERNFRKILYNKGIFPNPGVSFVDWSQYIPDTDLPESNFEYEKDTFLNFCRNLDKVIEWGPGEFTLWLPQYDWIYENKKCLVDFVGRYENLQEDFNWVCKKLKIDSNVKFGDNGKNRSIESQLKYKDFYFSGEIVDLVYKFYKNDFEEFGYEKDVDKAFTQLENVLNNR
tara:strand:- start:927 stop:1739 length:813 start_codon:yes stop_codon:yes gene_type:complete